MKLVEPRYSNIGGLMEMRSGLQEYACVALRERVCVCVSSCAGSQGYADVGPNTEAGPIARWTTRGRCEDVWRLFDGDTLDALRLFPLGMLWCLWNVEERRGGLAEVARSGERYRDLIVIIPPHHHILADAHVERALQPIGEGERSRPVVPSAVSGRCTGDRLRGKREGRT